MTIRLPVLLILFCVLGLAGLSGCFGEQPQSEAEAHLDDFFWHPFLKYGPDAAVFGHSRNGPLVSDIDDDKVTFAAAEPHVLVVNGRRVADITATEDGRLFHGERHIGFVALAVAPGGEHMAVLTGLGGMLLDLSIEDGQLVVEQTLLPPPTAFPFLPVRTAMISRDEMEPSPVLLDLGLVRNRRPMADQSLAAGPSRVEIAD